MNKRILKKKFKQALNNTLPSNVGILLRKKFWKKCKTTKTGISYTHEFIDYKDTGVLCEFSVVNTDG